MRGTPKFLKKSVERWRLKSRRTKPRESTPKTAKPQDFLALAVEAPAAKTPQNHPKTVPKPPTLPQQCVPRNRRRLRRRRLLAFVPSTTP